MKKIFSKLILLLLCVVVIVGCNRQPKIPITPITPTTPTTPTTPGTDNPVVVEPPQKKPITEYFKNNVDATYVVNNDYVTDYDGTTIKFKDALERQINLFSEDLLYRLFAVYGSGIDSFFQEYIITYNNKNYSSITRFNLIMDPKEIINETEPTYLYSTGEEVKKFADTVYFPNFNEVASFAYPFRYYKWDIRDTAFDTSINYVFHLRHAMVGGFTFAGIAFNQNVLNRFEHSWNWHYSVSNNSKETSLETFYSYKIKYFNELKTAIANILANNLENTYTYEQALNNIDHLGFTNEDKLNIINFIYNVVIGRDLVIIDNMYKDSLISKIPNCIIDDNTLPLIDFNEHYYKAYSLLIPRIVEQAVNNKYIGTDKPLHTNINLTEIVQTTININSLQNKNFSSIKLYSRTSNVPLTKLLIKISNVELDKINIYYNIYINSTTKIASNVKINIPINSSRIEIDLSGYNGNKLSSSGYIELIFQNHSNLNFTINLEGYYNKI